MWYPCCALLYFTSARGAELSPIPSKALFLLLPTLPAWGMQCSTSQYRGGAGERHVPARYF